MVYSIMLYELRIKMITVCAVRETAAEWSIL